MRSRWRRITSGRLILIGLVIGASALAVRAAGVIGSVIFEEANGARREKEVTAPLALPRPPVAPLLTTKSDSPEKGVIRETEQPTISFIDSPSATCYQPDSSRNTCYVTWSYLYVSASASQYIISMTVSLNSRPVAYHSGFFQTSMYIPGNLYSRGFKVACGPRGANELGNSYAYTLRARETGGLGAANYGSVRCPGVYLVYAPIVRR